MNTLKKIIKIITVIIRVLITLFLTFCVFLAWYERALLESIYRTSATQENAEFITIIALFLTLIYVLFLLWRKHYINMTVCFMIILFLIYNYYRIEHYEDYIPEKPTQTAEQQEARKNKGLENAKELEGKQFNGDDGSLIIFMEDGGFEFYPSKEDAAMPEDRFYGDSVEVYYGQDAVEYYVYDSPWGKDTEFLTEEYLLGKIAWRKKQVSDCYCLVKRYMKCLTA